MTKNYFQKTKMVLRIKNMALMLLMLLFTLQANAQTNLNLLQTTNNSVTAGAITCISPHFEDYNVIGWGTSASEHGRLYNLTALGYSGFEVTKVNFAVKEFQPGTATHFPVTVKVYASTGGVDEANLTLKGEATVNITAAMEGTIVAVTLPTPAVITSSEMFIVVSAPRGVETLSQFVLGANTDGETAPGYAKSCDQTVFKTLAELDRPINHFVIFPIGNSISACPPENVTLTTQAQVDQFIIDYPNCTEITGNLLIGVTSGASSITNLAPLRNVTSIGGYLIIRDNTALTNIDALNSLASVGGFLLIRDNAALTNIDGLNSLTHIGTSFEISANRNLESLGGFRNLTNIGTYMYLNHTKATNITGFNKLSSVGTFVVIDGNTELTNVDFMSQITTIKDNFGIRNNNKLQNLDGFSNLTSVGGRVQIVNNTLLNDISGLMNIDPNTIAENGLIITGNPALAVCNLPNFCSYLANPASTHPRDISGNLAECVNEAAVIAACNSQQNPPGNVTLSTQAQVNQFVLDYPNCTEIQGHLFIGVSSGISDITNLAPLNKLVNISGNLNLERISIGTVNGLNNLASVGGYVYIGLNPLLTQINGLNNLTSIGSSLNIRDNTILTTISGLNKLTSIGSFLQIRSNSVLVDISGLQNITSGMNQLTIANNPALAVCNLPNFCCYLANPASTHPRDISGNLAECVNEAAVVAACEASSVGENRLIPLSFYPNPVNNVLNIVYGTEITRVLVANLLGQTVLTQNVNADTTQIDMSLLPAGNYFVKVISEVGVTTIQIIKK